ncbi:DUF6152 family protein [Polynucleobacter sp. UB-Siik-W21]|uniref:DUF6152 family protein n=1 Tax=Polynucleobacter sp. UB-Siik-W21 TaxID=1855646 RepID=UPI001BFD261A|nr:DUF6152 family protein [Polynucleobacter sp. UB-Siik-W21]QWD69708.1 hypothetical protein C2756_07230 [Polynucleobacter sp. UB-Siik-W21]
MKHKIFTRLAAFAIVISASPLALAHHATTMFDRDKVMTITGVVKEVQWTNPHVGIFVTGTLKDNDTPALWVLEVSSPGNLTRAGNWTRSSVKAGDKVSVDFWPLRNGSKGGYLKKVTLTDTGKFYTADIRAQESPNLEEREQK